MTSLTELRELADGAIENAAECPDCSDNRWDLDDAATPEVIKALVAVAEAAEVLLRDSGQTRALSSSRTRVQDALKEILK